MIIWKHYACIYVICTAVGPGSAPISISIVPSVANPVLGGENYHLTCNLTGVSTSHCEWRKNNSIIEGETARMLSFSPLKLSHAGKYKCGCTHITDETLLTFVSTEIDVIVQSKTELLWYYSQFLTISNDSLFIAVPRPTSVLVRSHPANPIGTDVTLTCIVELSQAVDIPVTVNTYLLGPVGFSVNNSVTVMGRTTTYTTTAVISSFGIDNTGSYICVGALNSTKSNEDLLTASTGNGGQTRITTGKSHM